MSILNNYNKLQTYNYKVSTSQSGTSPPKQQCDARHPACVDPSKYCAWNKNDQTRTM